MPRYRNFSVQMNEHDASKIEKLLLQKGISANQFFKKCVLDVCEAEFRENPVHNTADTGTVAKKIEGSRQWDGKSWI